MNAKRDLITTIVHVVHVDRGGHIDHAVYVDHNDHNVHIVHVVHLLRVQNLPIVVVIVFVKQVYFDFANQGAKLKNIIDCHHLSPWLINSIVVANYNYHL